MATYTINATPNNPSYGSVTGGGTYNEGESATLTAIANSGYEFIEWQYQGSPVTSNNPFVITNVKRNYDFVAVFQLIPPMYDLVINVQPKEEAGTVTGAGRRPGGVKTVTATESNVKYGWIGWYANADDPDDQPLEYGYSYTFTLDRDIALYARFERRPQTHTVVAKASSREAGLVSVNGKINDLIYEGRQVHLVATPNSSDIFFENWSLNGEIVSTEPECTFRLPECDDDIMVYVATFSGNIPDDEGNNNNNTPIYYDTYEQISPDITFEAEWKELQIDMAGASANTGNVDINFILDPVTEDNKVTIMREVYVDRNIRGPIRNISLYNSEHSIKYNADVVNAPVEFYIYAVDKNDEDEVDADIFFGNTKVMNNSVSINMYNDQNKEIEFSPVEGYEFLYIEIPTEGVLEPRRFYTNKIKLPIPETIEEINNYGFFGVYRKLD